MIWKSLRRILFALVLSVALGFIFLPIVAVFISMPPGQLIAQLNTQVSYQALLLSMQTTVISLGIIVSLGTPLAYWLAKSKFRGQRILRTAVQLPIVSPPAVAGVGLLLVFGRAGLLGHTLTVLGLSLSFNTAAVVIAQVFISVPFFITAAMQAFESVDNKLLSVSRTLGVSPWKTFWRVSVPLALPGLLSGAALAWGRALGEFGATMMFAGNLPNKTQTLPLAIFAAMQSNVQVAVAMSALLLLVSFALLLLVMLIGHAPKKGRKASQGGMIHRAIISVKEETA